MRKTRRPLIITATLMLAWGCGSAHDADLDPGAEVTIEMPDGSFVTGHVAEPMVDREQEVGASDRPEDRSSSVEQDPVAAGTASPETESAEVTVPIGTTLALTLDDRIASDLNRVDDAVHARIERPVMVDGVLAIPEGTRVLGRVTTVEASGKVQGRATVALLFDRVDIDSRRYEIHSEAVSYRASSTKTDDAKKIGIGAGAGAVIGGLLGGKKGAGAGAAIGGGAGTAMVLTTAGDEVELPAGSPVAVSLSQPLTLMIPNG